MFLSSDKFRSKAEEVLKEGLERKPTLAVIEKIQTGADTTDKVNLDGKSSNEGGMMLYTSGTTSRPVWTCMHGFGSLLTSCF